MPLVIVGAGMLVRLAMSVSSKHQINFADFSGIVVKSLHWTFFVGAIKFGTSSIVGNSNLVTKIYFPREVFPLAAVLARPFDAAIASSVTILLLILGRVGVSMQLLWVPLILALIVVFTAAMAMLLSCGNLFFRDVKYLVDVLLTFRGLSSRRCFTTRDRWGNGRPFLLVNPLSSPLEALNNVVVLHEAPSFSWLGYAALCAVIELFGAWVIFDRAEATFAENI